MRCLHAVFLLAKNICYNVCKKEHNRLDAADAYEERDDEAEANQLSPEQKQRQHTILGVYLYSAIPLHYFAGSYRLLDFKNFPKEIGIGWVLDFFLYALPILCI